MTEDFERLTERYYRGLTTLEEEHLLFGQEADRDRESPLALFGTLRKASADSWGDGDPEVERRLWRVLALPGRRRFPRVALAAALAIALVGVGWAVGQWGAQPAPAPVSRIAELERQVRELHESLASTLLTSSSAADRLRGLDLASRLVDLRPTLAETVGRLAITDSSVGVRLAALEALYLHSASDLARERLLDVIGGKQPPLVQSRWIDVASALADPRAVELLRELADRDAIDPLLKAKIGGRSDV